MTQRDLGAPELSDCHISLIEAGKRNPGPEALEILARKLGCSPTFLQHGVSEEMLADLPRRLRCAQNALDGGRAEEALSLFSGLVHTPGSEKLPALHWQARLGQALSLAACGQTQRALIELETAAAAAFANDWDEWAAVQVCLCRCYRRRGDLTTAIDVAERALVTLRTHADEGTRAWIHVGVSLLDAYRSRGDAFTARRFAGRLVRAADDAADARQRLAAYLHAAATLEVLGDREVAVRLATRGLALVGDDIGDTFGGGAEAVERAGLLLVRGRPGDVEQARGLLSAHRRSLGRAGGSTSEVAACTIELARAELAANRPHAAAARAREALELLAGADHEQTARALAVLGRALARNNEHGDAIEAMERSASCLEQSGHYYDAARAWYDVAELTRTAGAGSRLESVSYERALTLMGLTAFYRHR